MVHTGTERAGAAEQRGSAAARVCEHGKAAERGGGSGQQARNERGDESAPPVRVRTAAQIVRQEPETQIRLPPGKARRAK